MHTITASAVEQLAEEFKSQSAEALLEWGLAEFGDRLALSTAFQVDGAVLLDIAYRLDPKVRVFSLDTGRLPDETYAFVETLRAHYPGLNLGLVKPDSLQVEQMVTEKGLDLFYESVDNRVRCCDVRKVQPLRQVLAGLDAWVTGLRRDQGETRTNVQKVELDLAHEGIIKLNPLADWTLEEVWEYVRQNDLPYHPLYDQGYASIGCGPCTRAVKPGEGERAGRWWWEEEASKECGIHFSPQTGKVERQLKVIG